MTPHATVIATELITTIQALGNEGGLISPSIYDTAQTLRYAPLPETEAAVIAWLADKQQADGGWGDPATPYARTMPTLAALLAIHTRACPGDAADLIERGITFLHAQAPLWHELSDDIPIAAELIIPTLARTALTAELAVPLTAYAQLEALGRRRRQLLTRAPVRPATPLAHSWEAWGTVATAALLDGAGSIGHNPAATAAWIHAASAQAALADHVACARRYLHDAAATCAFAGPGVVPGVYPSPRNEQILALYHLQLFGLLAHPSLRAAVEAQVAALWSVQRVSGYGLSDWFHTDGDLTSMAYAVLLASGYHPDARVLRAYLAADGHSCLSYPDELQRSRSTTAHAAHAMYLFGDAATAAPLLDYVFAARDGGYRLGGDKWHATWLYLSSHTGALLCQMGALDQALPLLVPVLADQHADGGWGISGSTLEETAYAVLLLRALHRADVQRPTLEAALHRAGRYFQNTSDQALLWFGKEIYRPYRVVRVLELAAMLVCAEHNWGV